MTNAFKIEMKPGGVKVFFWGALKICEGPAGLTKKGDCPKCPWSNRRVTCRKPMMKLKTWWLAIRPKTLPAAFCPVLAGTACAVSEGVFSPLIFTAVLAGTLLIQISVNLANDYFDFKNGIDTRERKGPIRVTQSGLISPASVRNAFILTLGAALVPGIFLIWIGGKVILAVAAASVICTVCYSGGPYPIASNGLGDIFVFLFFGPVAVCGTTYLMTGTVSASSLAVSVPVGFLITAILVVNNLRDMETDARAGKRTLAVIIGQANTRAEYMVLVLGAFLIPCLVFATGLHAAAVLMPLAAFPLSVPMLRAVSEQKGEALNAVLARTAKLAFWFSLLLSLGVILG